ncbi:hypothetical protein D3C76_1764390 [compost metagenome]
MRPGHAHQYGRTAVSESLNGLLHHLGDSGGFDNAVNTAAAEFADGLYGVLIAGIDDMGGAQLKGEFKPTGDPINHNALGATGDFRCHQG